MAHVIEPAKSGRSSCKHCGTLIPAGELRFGLEIDGWDGDMTVIWFHLKCGAENRTGAYLKAAAAFKGKLPNFGAGAKGKAGGNAAAKKAPAKKAAAKAAKGKGANKGKKGAAKATPAKARVARKVATVKPARAKAPAKKNFVPARNPELEATLLEDPENEQARLVYADWLQSQGDPWGEVIALEHAEKTKEALKIRRENQVSFTADLAPKTFGWEGGFITRAWLSAGSTDALSALFDKVVQLRTTLLLRDLSLAGRVDKALLEKVSKKAPASLRKLFLWQSEVLGALTLPKLERLSIMIERPASVAAFRPIFEGKNLPALRSLEIVGHRNGKATPEFLQALVESPLLRKLKRLGLTQGIMDAAGLQYLISVQKSLAHLEYLELRLNDAADEMEPALQEAFGKRLDGDPDEEWN